MRVCILCASVHVSLVYVFVFGIFIYLFVGLFVLILIYLHMYVLYVLITHQWRSNVPKSGGAHRHVIFVPSVKNEYKRVVFGCMVI